MVGGRVELVVGQSSADETTPYERLLGDAIRGGALLFVREDGVEASWSVGDPILGDVTPLHEYEPNTWGPTEADQIIAVTVAGAIHGRPQVNKRRLKKFQE